MAIACASYLLLRALILYTAFDDVALWAYEIYMCGSVARFQLGGGGELPLPYFYDNAAGPVLMGLVVAPFYALCGSSYLALKLVPMALGLGTLVLTWSILRRLFDARIANLAAMLIAFAPTTLTKYTLIGAGNHSENVCFTLLATWSFFEMHARGVSWRRLAQTGLFAGWAFAIFIGALTPIGLLAIAHFGLRGWRRAFGDLIPTIAGFAIGFAPVVWLNHGSGGRGLAFLAAKFGEESAKTEPFWPRALEFVTEHLPSASTYPSFLGLPGRVADVLFTTVMIAGFLACAPMALRAVREFVSRQFRPSSDERGALQRAFVFCAWAYLPLTVIAYASSNLKIGGYEAPLEAGGYRYFLPQFGYAIILIAITSGIWQSATTPWKRGVGIAFALAPFCAGAFNLALIDVSFARPNVGAHYEGHNVSRVATTLQSRTLNLPMEQVIDYADQFSPQLRWRVYWGLGYSKTLPILIKNGTPDLEEILSVFPPHQRGDVARGVGTALRFRQAKARHTLAADEPLLIGWLERDAPFAAQVLEGLCFDWAFITSSRTPTFLDDNTRLFEQADPRLRPALARGLGHACGRLMRREIAFEAAILRAALERVPSEHRELALQGFGAGLADGAEVPRISASAGAGWTASESEAVLTGFATRIIEIWGTFPGESRAELDSGLDAAWTERWSRLTAK